MADTFIHLMASGNTGNVFFRLGSKARLYKNVTKASWLRVSRLAEKATHKDLSGNYWIPREQIHRVVDAGGFLAVTVQEQPRAEPNEIICSPIPIDQNTQAWVGLRAYFFNGSAWTVTVDGVKKYFDFLGWETWKL